MGHLILDGDGFIYKGFALVGETSLAMSLIDTGTGGFGLDFLILRGTTSVSIGSAAGSALAGGYNLLHQLAEANNVLTTVTISGFVTNSSELFILGSPSGNSNTGDGVVTATLEALLPMKIASSLTLIDASATTGGVEIYAGATNTSGAGAFVDGDFLAANVTITYTGLTIKGGSGNDIIENEGAGRAATSMIVGGPIFQ
jgi:hypothetical protein